MNFSNKLLFILLFFSNIIIAQVECFFECPYDTVALNQVFEVKYVLKYAASENPRFGVDPISDFQKITGPNTKTNFEIKNGKRTASQEHSYMLLPKKHGIFCFPGALYIIQSDSCNIPGRKIYVSDHKLSADDSAAYRKKIKNNINTILDDFLNQAHEVRVKGTLNGEKIDPKKIKLHVSKEKSKYKLGEEIILEYWTEVLYAQIIFTKTLKEGLVQNNDIQSMQNRIRKTEAAGKANMQRKVVVLKANKKGTYRIEPAYIIVGERKFYSKPIRIKIK